MNGVITSGNYSFQTVELDGDTEIRGGNFVLCRITTNGFALTLTGGNRRGLYVDGVKQNPFVWQSKGPWATALAIKAKLESGGEDAWDAFEIAVDIIQAAAAGQTWNQFVNEYANIANGTNLTYSLSLFNRIRDAINPNWTWAQVRDAIRAQPRDRLLGLDTEVLEERS